MEVTSKLHPGQPFVPETFKRLDGADLTFGEPGSWQALFIYRGQHCGACKSYLRKLEGELAAFEALGLRIASLSADSEAQTRLTQAACSVSFPLLYGLDIAAMKRLGLYISEPVSAEETDHIYSEPALLVVNPEGALQVVELTNVPFLRPDMGMMLTGFKAMIGKGASVHGTLR